MIALLVATAGAQTPPEAFGRFDRGDVTIVRPVGDAFGAGFVNRNNVDASPFDQAVIAALEGRQFVYDFVMVFLGQDLPRQIPGALAFNETHNRDIAGTGRWEVRDERFAVRSVLYMNRTSIWSTFPVEYRQWVFNHEIGHHWLAYVALDQSTVLLGRQLAHWTYFLDTGNAPMEGNAWIDNGDGTFTTDPGAGPGPFSDLELYLMGRIGPEEVAPFFLIDPTDPAGRVPASAPDHWNGDAPTTVAGTRIDLTVEDIIESNGPVVPGGNDPDDYRFLTVLVVAPEEIVDESDLVRIQGLHALWSAGFYQATRELAGVTFDAVDEGLTVPTIEAPRWIPEAAR